MDRTLVSSIFAGLVVAQPPLAQTSMPMSPARMTCEEFVATPKVVFKTKVRELYKSGRINLFDTH